MKQSAPPQNSLKVIQCWDDGVTTDIRLAELLRKHQAKATFNLNAGLYGARRGTGWTYQGTEVLRLAKHELASVYDGFTIANHSLTHPYLEQLPLKQAQREIVDNRKQLQDLFDQPVDGFAYPFGTFNQAVKDLLRDSGHRYARGVARAAPVFPVQDPFEFNPSCHFRDPDFWARYEQAKQASGGGVFYFWGHSYEMVNQAMWDAFEQQLQRISQDPQSTWCDVRELFC